MIITEYIAGGLSGIVEVIFTHPLDYLKTKNQEYIQTNIKTNLYKTVLKEPKLKLYNGIVPRTLGVVPMRFTFWGVQDNVLKFCKHKNFNKNTSGILSGLIGGYCQTFIDNPIENIKVQSMTNQKVDLLNIIKYNYGYMATLNRNVIFAICMSTICFNNRTNNNVHNFALSATGGLVGSIITQPLDYVKTELQRTQQQKSILYIIKKTYKEHPAKLYTGIIPRTLLNFFSMGIGFVAYDNFYKLICRL